MDGSRVLVKGLGFEILGLTFQGQDFGIPGSTPPQFSASDRPHLKSIDVRKWGSPVRIEDSVTGKEVFQLSGKYANNSAI